MVAVLADHVHPLSDSRSAFVGEDDMCPRIDTVGGRIPGIDGDIATTFRCPLDPCDGCESRRRDPVIDGVASPPHASALTRGRPK